MRRPIQGVLFVMLAAVASTAMAQTPQASEPVSERSVTSAWGWGPTRVEEKLAQPRRGATRAPHQPMGLRLFGYVDIESEAAKQSFKAVTGSSILIGYGAGLELTHLAGPLFLRFAYGQASHSGERVIVSGEDVFSTDIPITVKKSPLEAGVGFRGGRPSSSMAPFVGAGLLLLRYQETTTQFAEASDNTSQTFTGFNVFGGVDLSMGKHFSIGAEGQYRTVRNAIGEAGVSATYGEKDLGGFGARVSFGFKK